MRSLERERELQVTLANLIGATRFKTLEKSKLYITKCPRCKIELGDWAHHKKCYGISVPIREGEETKKEWEHSMKEYMKKIVTKTPAKYLASSVLYEKFYEEIEGGRR